ncbi:MULTISPECIES: hypothetical protein [unclassified Bradyrhizobium]|uniref:hypothetical protein n=1 Tax=unclassified Bradyrhizobium TaxID=2631580 RepID=UPI0029168D2A|nr:MULTISPECIES: hypothetical protein [unclassified Bradyrhizobium]
MLTALEVLAIRPRSVETVFISERVRSPSFSTVRSLPTASLLAPNMRTAAIKITGVNSSGIASANDTVASDGQQVVGAHFDHLHIQDIVPAYASQSTVDHNAAVIFENFSDLYWSKGWIDAQCQDALVIWRDTQGAIFDGVNFQSGCTHYIEFGGGLNSFISINNPTFSWTPQLSAMIDIGAGTAPSLGGLWHFNMRTTDVAGSPPPNGLISRSEGRGAFLATNGWLWNCDIEGYVGDIYIPEAGVDHCTFRHIFPSQIHGAGFQTNCQYF